MGWIKKTLGDHKLLYVWDIKNSASNKLYLGIMNNYSHKANPYMIPYIIPIIDDRKFNALQDYIRVHNCLDKLVT